MHKNESQLNQNQFPKKNKIDFRLISEQVSDIVFYLEPDSENNFIFLYANQAFYNESGLNPDDVLGKKIYEVMPEINRTLSAKKFEEAISNKKEVEWRMSTNFKAGTKVGSVKIVPKFNENDKCTGIAVIINDLTKLEKAEKSLSEIEDRWKFATEGAGDGVWDWNPQTNEVFFSKQWKEMLGFNEDEIGNSLEEWEKRIHPDDKEKVYFGLQNYLNGETPYYSNEHRVLCKDGSYKWILDRGKVFQWTDDGKPLRIIGTHTDISTQKKDREEILRNEKLLRLFIKYSPASIAMFDNNMVYIIASNRFKIDYDLGDQKLIGRSHYEVFPDIPERWKEIHKRCLAGETIKENEDLFPRASGKPDWVRWEIRPWYETGDKIGGIILFSEVISKQKLAKEKLHESEKYNRMLFNQSPIGLAVAKMDGKLVDVNQSYANIIGYTIDETKSLTYWDITPEEYGEQEKLQLNLLNETRKYGPYEKEYIHKDGHLVPVRLNGKIIERNGEKFIWSSVEDITERKTAEEQIKNLSNIVSNSLNEIYIFDAESLKFYFVNNGALKNLGFSNEEILNLTPVDIKPEFTPAIFWDTVKPLIDGEKEIINFETIHQRKDLTTYPVDVYLQLSRFNKKKVFVAIILDITGRKRAEEELKTQKHFVSSVVDTSPAIIYVFDLESNRNVYINSGMERLLGYSSKEIHDMGENVLADLLHPDDLPAIIEFHSKIHTASNDDTLIIEYRMKNRKGEWRTLQSEERVFKRNADGSVKQKIGIATDITDRKIAEQEIKKLNEDLEQKVEERTADLETKIAEIERMNRLFVGRELRMKELKDKIKALEELLKKK